jgi:hypothetical protein
MAAKLTHGQRDHRSQIFVVTNYAEDLTLDANEGTAGNIAKTLATLISELKAKGVIEATIA